jgi:hypothetical protein
MMQLPNIFERSGRSKSAQEISAIQSSDDDVLASAAPVSEFEDLREKANDGWKRAFQTKKVGISKEASVGNTDKRPANRRGLKAAAFGFGKSTNSSQDSELHEEEYKKKMEEGWSRTQKMRPHQGKLDDDKRPAAKDKAKGSIKSAVVGLVSKEPNILSSDESLAQEIEKKADEGLKRLKNMKSGHAAESGASSTVGKQRSNILAAAVGISALETNLVGSSDSLITEDIEKKAEEGLKRIQNLKNGPAHTHEKAKPVKVRTNVLAAAVGMAHVEQNLLTGSSDSLLSDEAEKKAQEGLERLRHMKVAPAHHEAPRAQPRSQRPSILSAAMGIVSNEEQKPFENSKTKRLSLTGTEKPLTDPKLNPATKPQTNPVQKETTKVPDNPNSRENNPLKTSTKKLPSDTAGKSQDNPLKTSTKKLPNETSVKPKTPVPQTASKDTPPMNRQASTSQKSGTDPVRKPTTANSNSNPLSKKALPAISNKK